MKVYSLKDFGKGPKSGSNVEAGSKSEVKNLNNKQDLTGNIVVDFNSFVDIPRIHKFVLALFDETFRKLNEINSTLNELEFLYFEDPEVDIKNQLKIESLKHERKKLLRQLENHKDYVSRSSEYMRHYEELIPKNHSRVIGSKEVGVTIQNLDNFKILVADFVNLAKQFTDRINVITTQNSITKCLECDGDTYVIDSTAICKDCNAKVKLKETSSTDIHAGSDSSGEYYHLETFIEYMDEYEGKRKKPIPPEVLKSIMNYCQTYAIDVKTIRKRDLEGIVHTLRFNSCYKSINLIHHLLTSEPLPNITKYRKACLDRHPKLDKAYSEIKEDVGRSNFLNVGHVLRAFLQMEGCKCNPDDFVSLSTRDALVNSERLMIKLCKKIKATMTPEELETQSWDFNGLT
jgi:hypothetical protein